jgi:hypothetical protein
MLRVLSQLSVRLWHYRRSEIRKRDDSVTVNIPTVQQRLYIAIPLINKVLDDRLSYLAVGCTV